MFGALLNGRILLTTAIELLAMRVWHRSLAKFRRMRSGGGSPKAPAACPSPAARLPPEIVEMIIAHLMYDTPSLLTCSLTCYSWYIATCPQLHRTLTIIGTLSLRQFRRAPYWRFKRWVWPRRLEHMDRLGLLPMVKKLQVHDVHFINYGGLPPGRLKCRT